MNVLNQWAKDAEVSEGGGFAPHPLGDFPGVIVSIKQKTIEKTGQAVWNINVKTAHGTGQYTIWGFTDKDMQEANTKQDARDQLLATLGRYKRLFVDLGVFTKEEAKSLGWDEGPHSVIGALNSLMGKACMLHVETNMNNPKYQNIYINAPQANQNSGMDNLPQNQQAPMDQSMGPAGMTAAPPFDDTPPSPLAPPQGFS